MYILKIQFLGPFFVQLLSDVQPYKHGCVNQYLALIHLLVQAVHGIQGRDREHVTSINVPAFDQEEMKRGVIVMRK